MHWPRRLLAPFVVALALVGACADSIGGGPSNTELNVVVPNGAPSLGGGSSAPAVIDIQSVEYTINCLGNDDTFLENNASFPDEVQLNGNLEVVDGRTNAAANLPPNPDFGPLLPNDQSEVWQGFMDLPPGDCTVELRARDNDGEVICTALEPFTITADTTTKVNLILLCQVSFQAPVGMLDVDATFSFVVSNFCPDLFILNCLDSAPAEQQVLPPPNPPLAGTQCEVRYRDGDSTCGNSCDPQTCVPTGDGSGLTCTPGPDPGVSTTITCTDALLDCDGDGLQDPSCTWNGDVTGVLGQGPADFPGAPPAGTFFVTCIPPSLGGLSGSVATCTAVTTDGDTDCDKTKVVNVDCPGVDFCEALDQNNGGTGTQAGADAVCQAAAGTVCVASFCNEAACGGVSSVATCCENVNAPAGTDCSAEDPPLAECDGAGTCLGGDCTDDSQCDDGNICTFDTCDLGTGLCVNVGAPNDGDACSQGGGPPTGSQADDGLCFAGVCLPVNSACTIDADCPNTPAAPADPQCTGGVCETPTGFSTVCGIDLGANAGGVCDFSAPGSQEGFCTTSGECIFSCAPCADQSAIVSVACTNSVTTAQSTFPFTLEIGNVNNGTCSPIGGDPFTVDFDGVGVFPEFFLDAAQGVVPGGVQTAELVDIVATVQVRSGATGPDVPLFADTSSLTPGAVTQCTIPAGQICTVLGPGSPDCAGGFGDCTVPVVLADLPTSFDCSVGGVCDTLGKGNVTDPPGTQCSDNGFCMTGDLIIEFAAVTGNTYLADPGAGSVRFGWADQGVPGLTLCPGPAGTCDEPFMPDGCYDLPDAVFGNPTGPIGIRVNASGLFVPIQCAMATAGGICASGEGCLVDADCATAPCTITTDVACPTPTNDLPFCPRF